MKNFLHVNDLSSEHLSNILDKTSWIKKKFKDNEPYTPLNGLTMAMIFAKPSARTRISFETGFYRMGGHALYLGPNDIGIGKRESVEDIARVISRFNDIIMARLFEHKHVLTLAKYSTVPKSEIVSISTKANPATIPGRARGRATWKNALRLCIELT